MNLILTLNILLLKANVMMSDLNKQVILFCLYIYILKFGKKVYNWMYTGTLRYIYIVYAREVLMIMSFYPHELRLM